jgi:hypothetical protein
MTTINIYDGGDLGDLGAVLVRIEEKLDQLTRDLAAFTATEAQA